MSLWEFECLRCGYLRAHAPSTSSTLTNEEHDDLVNRYSHLDT